MGEIVCKLPTCVQGAHMYASAPKRALATSSMHFRSALAIRMAAKCTPNALIAVSRARLLDPTIWRWNWRDHATTTRTTGCWSGVQPSDVDNERSWSVDSKRSWRRRWRLRGRLRSREPTWRSRSRTPGAYLEDKEGEGSWKPAAGLSPSTMGSRHDRTQK
jgi:hypothetical protein